MERDWLEEALKEILVKRIVTGSLEGIRQIVEAMKIHEESKKGGERK